MILSSSQAGIELRYPQKGKLMGIEAIGRGISAAPAIGRGGFGLEGGFKVGSIKNPGLGGFKPSSYIENGSLTGVIKNPFKAENSRINSRPQFSVAAVVAEAERIVSIAKRPAVLERRILSGTANIVRTLEPAIVRLPNPTRGLDARVIRNPFIAPKVEAEPQVFPAAIVGTQVREQTRTVNRTSTPTQKEVLVQQMIEQKKTVQEKKKTDTTQEKKTEENSTKKMKIVKSFKVAQRRIEAVVRATKKLAETEEKFSLNSIRRVLRWTKEHLSPIVREKGVDGTLKLIDEALASDTTEYTSRGEIERKSVALLEQYKPVEAGEGNPVTVEEVRQVLEGKEAEVTRGNVAAEIVVKRLVRKTEVIKGEDAVPTISEDKQEETSLKDFPALAGVFQKGA